MQPTSVLSLPLQSCGSPYASWKLSCPEPASAYAIYLYSLKSRRRRQFWWGRQV